MQRVLSVYHMRDTCTEYVQHILCITQGGWLQAGAFRIGDTAGTLDNIIACKLHRPGSVGFVSKSGGMSNEMYNVLSRATDGLYEGKWVLRTLQK